MPEAMVQSISLLLTAPLAGLMGNALLQILIAWIVSGGAHLRTQFLSFGFGMIVTVVTLAGLLWQHPVTQADRIGYLLLHVLIYACFGFCFFNMVNANISSLRVRLIKEYLMHDPAPLPDEIVFQRYSSREILEARLARLLAGGQIYATSGRYYVRRGIVVWIGRFFAALRRLLLGASSAGSTEAR